MARIALVLGHELEDRILADVVEHGHVVVARLVSARELVGSLDALAPEVVLVGAGRATLGRELLAACDQRGVRVVALAANDLEHHHARHVGLLEVADAGADWSAIEALVEGAVMPGDAPRAADAKRGTVLAVWGPTGAPGRTTVAINLAASFVQAGRSVVLVDADAYGGAVAPQLGLLDAAPGFAAACRLAGSDALDRAELDRLAQRHTAPGGSFRVLTGLAGTRRWPELAADRVAGVLDALRGWADLVVVDTGFCLERDEELSTDVFAPRRNAATVAAVEVAERTVAVGQADTVGLARFVRGYADLLEFTDASRVHPVVNRVRASVLGLDPGGQARHALQRLAGITDATLLPDDRRATDAALLVARPLVEAAPRSPLALGVRGLAERLAPGGAGAAPRRVRRLLARA
ncbi:pilus biosynthesis protein CpaE [Agromyces rhizosphaerae]|uniref:Pilus biosynthesis protein CpaE n=1 Tax=Agromyces rhizosphaerae TaxID=88374 RepID=A0A9W6CY88_9MICO|nr:regulator [Agromyces rhizosphaerae]GLI26048.1 pilus biosynthesis protein CpaE [Agromyces rhizosphaerae]